ncbi:hypothetical protein J3A83DRAFT_3803272 [Scleroderma citrinum]
MGQTNQTFNALAVVPFTMLLYDYATTLDREVEYVWMKSKSIVTLIYLVLRYFGIILLAYYMKVFISDWSTSNDNKANDQIFSTLQLWPIVVETWLVHIILQIRLYALYNRSKRILFVVVLGFVIEVVILVVSTIRLTIFTVNNGVNGITDYSVAEAINGYIAYSVSLFYELLLFSLALWAAIRPCRRPRARNWIEARGLRSILIEGNVMYFLVILLFLVAYLTVSLAFPAEDLSLIINIGFSLYIITGCQIILHIRGAASQLSSSPDAFQAHSRGKNYSDMVFHVPTDSSTE